MKSKIHKIFIVVFLLIIGTPLLLFITRQKLEPRYANEKKISLNFKRNFPLKSNLVRLYSNLKTKVLKEDVFPRAVVDARNEWKFLGDKFSNAMLESKAVLVFSKEELDILKQNLLKKQAWFKKQNIQFYISISPNKHRLYGDMIPVKKRDRNTKFQQLDSLSKTIGVKIIDLGSNFHLEKEDLPLYNKTDSHWNHLGGYYAFLSTMEAISNDYKEINFSIYKRDDIKIKRFEWEPLGDLNRILQLDKDEYFVDVELKNDDYKYIKIPEKLSAPIGYYFETSFYEERYNSKTNELKALFFRDSFFGAYYKLIADNFGETVNIFWHNYNPKLILKEKPDLVCYEIVERNIDILLDDNLTHSPD